VDLVDKIYLDYAASTPVDKSVIDAMLPYFNNFFGNPSSIHFFGQQAENALEQSRREVAEVLHARPEEIIFTSCGTESDNLALRGTAFAQKEKRNASHLLISPVDHHAVLETARQLADLYGFELELLPVDRYGMVDPADVEAYLRPGTALVSVIYANNEIGTINPIAEIGEVCRKRGVPFHSDAVQAAAHLPMNVVEDNLDLLSIGAHKFYGPKGIGALYVKRGLPLIPAQTGGKQEAGNRAGTHNIPYIVGLAKAFSLAQQSLDHWSERMIRMRDRIVGRVLEEIPRTHLTGHPVKRLPNHASFVFESVNGNELLMMLDVAGFACSSGSACKVGDPKPSEVLEAIGLSASWTLGSLRITLGHDTTPEQVDRFLDVLPGIVDRVRALRN
jgi:cysteine desulfurase